MPSARSTEHHTTNEHSVCTHRASYTTCITVAHIIQVHVEHSAPQVVTRKPLHSGQKAIYQTCAITGTRVETYGVSVGSLNTTNQFAGLDIEASNDVSVGQDVATTDKLVFHGAFGSVQLNGKHGENVVKHAGSIITYDQLLEELQFEVVDACVDCGGIDHCIAELRRAIVDQKHLTSLKCDRCGVAHICDSACAKWHVCSAKTCRSRFARVEDNLVCNPLARYYDLVLRVRGSDQEVTQDVVSGQHGCKDTVKRDSTSSSQKNVIGSKLGDLVNDAVGVQQQAIQQSQPVLASVEQSSVVETGVTRDSGRDGERVQGQTTCGMENVSLQSFKRGLRRKQYQEVFFCFSRRLVDDDVELNFTHRAGYGTQGHGDVVVDDTQLASDTLQALKRDYPAVFSDPTFPVDRPSTFQHHIVLKDKTLDPPRKKLYPLDANELSELKKAVDELLESGRIVHSSSPYGAPILFAKKKDGRLRMCIDYRALNNNTVLDRYPLPRIDDLLQRLNGAKVFSKLDLRDGYHQLPMAKDDQHKTAFCSRYGQFEFTVMPFGLCNAPATFQRSMNQMLFELLDKCVLVYIDDILIYSKTVEEHKQHLQQVFKLLDKFQFKLKEKKCALFLKSVEFLGYTVTSEGLCVEQGKIDVVRDWPVPNTVNQVQQFLGMCNYYRRFIANFATIASPLTLLTKKDVTWKWDEPQKRAFEELKRLLTTAPLLCLFDECRATRVCCDASATCVGGVIEQQMPDGSWHPVEFFSKRLNDAQQNYSATERELLAVIMCLERWRHFLIGHEFKVLTDHVSLTYLHTQAKLSRRQARWLEFFSQFKFSFEHVQGRLNVVPDALSRVPEQVTECNAIITLNDQPLLFKLLRKRQEAALHTDADFASLHRRCSEEGDEHLREPASSGLQQRIRPAARHISKVTRGKVFDFRQGVLCRLVGESYVPVLPRSDRELVDAVCAELHNTALGGHLSVRKMYGLARDRFWWSTMRTDINNFCKQCAVCQANRSSTQAPSGLLVPHSVPSRPFECVSMDFITQLPMTERGYDAIFVIVDKFSKLVCLVPATSAMDAATCARLFFEFWVCRYGVPQRIISDRDPRFTSNFWQSLMKCLNCRLNMSSAYHPQTDGQTERFNRSVEQVIRCSISPQQHDWDIVLAQVAFSLNSTVHAGTSRSAFEIVFGMTPSLPIDTAVSQLSDSKVQAVHDFMTQRQNIQKQVKANLERYNQQMTAQANKHRRHMELSVGNPVWLSSRNLQLPSGLSRKFAARWIGPFVIEAQVSSVAYRLTLPQELSTLHPVFHISLLKPVEGHVEPRQPVFRDDSDIPEYEVERVIAKRQHKNSWEYLVMWKGYAAHEATWEPISNLSNAQEKIHEFERTGVKTRRQRQHI